MEGFIIGDPKLIFIFGAANWVMDEDFIIGLPYYWSMGCWSSCSPSLLSMLCEKIALGAFLGLLVASLVC
jgi:hypothetical protein